MDGQDIDVKVEYPEDEYRTIDQMKNITLTAQDGSSVALTDVAEVIFKDSPSSISREDKEYQVTISGDYTGQDVSAEIDSEVIAPNLTGTIKRGTSSTDQMMEEEFSALYTAIATAVFLLFVVMAAQFESPKFSFMVMTTIPFSLIGSFGFLKLTGGTMSMTSILGFLILVGTVVNNGMAMAIGSSGSTTQGLAVVDIGGLTVGLFVALFMLPVYYALMNRKPKAYNGWDID